MNWKTIVHCLCVCSALVAHSLVTLQCSFWRKEITCVILLKVIHTGLSLIHQRVSSQSYYTAIYHGSHKKASSVSEPQPTSLYLDKNTQSAFLRWITFYIQSYIHRTIHRLTHNCCTSQHWCWTTARNTLLSYVSICHTPEDVIICAKLARMATWLQRLPPSHVLWIYGIWYTLLKAGWIAYRFAWTFSIPFERWKVLYHQISLVLLDCV